MCCPKTITHAVINPAELVNTPGNQLNYTETYKICIDNEPFACYNFDEIRNNFALVCYSLIGGIFLFLVLSCVVTYKIYLEKKDLKEIKSMPEYIDLVNKI